MSSDLLFVVENGAAHHNLALPCTNVTNKFSPDFSTDLQPGRFFLFTYLNHNGSEPN
jgi:hypothetical protein